jgi:2-oxo-4-hydroxy-4-carboxy-5-ureidoimidazoline decarboxylase
MNQSSTNPIANPLPNGILTQWNGADQTSAYAAMLACCGAKRWAEAMTKARPIHGVSELSETADRLWATMQEADWLEAFACHPRIGERKAAHATAQSTLWSRQEQSSTAAASDRTLEEIARGNAAYEQQFGFTYIVCATGKSADEMLAILQRRLHSDRQTELREAAEQQRQIMQIRLGKWLTQ